MPRKTDSEGFIYQLGPATKRQVVNVNCLIGGIEDILNYHFFSQQLCLKAIQNDKERQRLANLPSIPDFGSIEEMAAAARQSGLEKHVYEGKVDRETLAITVKALLGAVLEESDMEEVLEAANNLGLESVRKVRECDEADLLGVEELRFVRCAASVPVVGSLI